MKRIIFTVLAFVSCSILADEVDDFNYLPEDQYNALLAFKLLSPIEQLESLLQVPQSSGMRSMNYFRCRAIFLKNPEAKSLLFSRFSSVEVPQYTDRIGRYVYFTLENIIREGLYYENLLTPDEELLLAKVYEKHLDYYFKTYKKLDAFSIYFEIAINRRRSGKDITFSPGYGLRTYEKYKNMGYEDLKYEYEEYIRPQP